MEHIGQLKLELVSHKGKVYYIDRRVRIDTFRNKETSEIDKEAVKLFRDHNYYDHVLQTADEYLFCRELPEAEVVEQEALPLAPLPQESDV